MIPDLNSGVCRNVIYNYYKYTIIIYYIGHVAAPVQAIHHRRLSRLLRWHVNYYKLTYCSDPHIGRFQPKNPSRRSLYKVRSRYLIKASHLIIQHHIQC